ncbi:MAG: hypothetical protein H6682_00570 [Candidatus Eisenbacteria bacterium]|nr:hypothetical protein [Candidatus Eisenbacteria bacterium]
MLRSILLALGVICAFLLAPKLERALDLHSEEKVLQLETRMQEPASETLHSAANPSAALGSSRSIAVSSSSLSPGSTTRSPLPLRLVDTGAVGIEADPALWKKNDYSHASLAFRDLVDVDAEVKRVRAEDGQFGPAADEDADAAPVDSIRTQWREYVDLMVEYGNNGIVIPAFLELIDFDRVGDGFEVYNSDSRIREHQRVLRARFVEFIEYAREQGMRVYLGTDMLATTPPLLRYLESLPGGLTPENPRVWDVFRAGIEELFARVPVDGVLVRIGEAGPLYRDPDSDYSSRMFVRDVGGLQAMLQGLLPAFEGTDHDLILRSWSVGLGELGELHTDPAVYEQALASVHSPNLIVSTKYVAGDYFGYFPINPTLLSGEHRRLVEFQCRREYEGFGVFPNFLGEVHQRALEEILAANPHVEGIYQWTQAGGPLRAGPMSLYLRTGTWQWVDANVYVTSKLAMNPELSVPSALADWARFRFPDSPVAQNAVCEVLSRSREAVERGLYVRPFAEESRWVLGVELPPLLWLHEWDMLSGWQSITSQIYSACRGRVDEAVADGYEALDVVKEMRASLSPTDPNSSDPNSSDSNSIEALRASLDYEISLFEVLATYRETFLRYYVWLEDGGSKDAWLEARREFVAAAKDHRVAYSDRVDFPAWELRSALNAAELASQGEEARWLARGLLCVFLATLAMGSSVVQKRTPSFAGMKAARYVWTATVHPWQVSQFGKDPSPPYRSLAGMILMVCALTALAFSSLSSYGMALVVLIGLMVFALGMKAGWSGPLAHPRDRFVPVVLAPLLLLCLPFLVILAWHGPQGFWLHFWTDAPFRVGFIGVVLASLVWVAVGVLSAAPSLGVVPARHALGAVCLGTGAVLALGSLLTPDITFLLRFLDQPLQVAPMSHSIVLGLVEYGGLGDDVLVYGRGLGIVLATAGLLLAPGHRR